MVIPAGAAGAAAAALPAGRRGAAPGRCRRRLSRRHGVDQHLRVRVQRLIAGACAVRLQDERRDARVGVRAERARAAGRHRQLDEGQQLARRAASPGADERRSRQSGVAVPWPRKIRLMTGGAVGLVRGRAGGRLGRGEWAGADRPAAGRPLAAWPTKIDPPNAISASAKRFLKVNIGPP